MRSLATELLVAAVLMGPLPQQTQSGSITGQVRASGTTQAAIRVSAVEAENPDAVASGTAVIVSLTQTDATGRYRLDNIPPGRYYIMAGFLDSPTYYPGTASLTDATPVTVRPGATLEAADFTIQRSVGVRVSGTVSRDPRAVVYADPLRVQLSNGALSAGPLEAQVGANGSFEFPRVPSGTYTARVFPGSMDYSSAAIQVTDKDIQDLRLTVPFTVNVIAHLFVEGVAPRFTLSFTDQTGLTRTPALNAGILSTNLASGASERLTIPLPEGEYRLTLPQVPAGFELQSIVQGPIDLLKEPLRISAGITPEIGITLAPGSPAPWVKVSGRITGTAPAGSLRVRLAGSAALRNLDVPVDADGAFEFPQVLPGPYNIGLTPNIAGSRPLALNVGASDIEDVVFAIPSTRLIRGRLTGDNGSPAPQFQFALRSPGNNAFAPLRISPTIGPDGTFSVTLPEGGYDIAAEGIPAGYRIKAMSYGTVDLLRDPRIRIAASDSSELRVTTDFTSPSPWVKVSGRTTRPVNSRVFLAMSGMAMRPTALEAAIGADGSFEFPRVAPGQYNLRLIPPIAGAREEQVVVGDRDVQDVELITPMVQTISGQTEIEDNLPIPRLSLSLVSANQPGALSINTNVLPSGRFQITVPEGEFRVVSGDLPGNYRVLEMKYGAIDLLKEPLKIAGPDVQELRIRIGLVAPVSKVRVSGRVSGAANLGRTSGRVQLSGAGLSQAFHAPLNQDGDFTFSEVASGNYTIQALPGVIDEATFVTIQSTENFSPTFRSTILPSSNPVNIAVSDKNIDGIQLTVPAVQTIPVRLVIENGTDAVPLFPLRLTLTGASETVTTTILPRRDGTLSLLAPNGDYRLGVQGVPIEYSITAIRRGAADLLKEPLRTGSPSSDELRITLAPRAR